MRALFVAPYLPTPGSGGRTRLVNFMEGLARKNHDLHIVAFLARDQDASENPYPGTVITPPPLRPRAMNQHGLTHLSFRVADLDATLAALRAAGERVLDETVIRFPAYQSAACFIVDPDGQLIELVQAPGDPAAPPRAG